MLQVFYLDIAYVRNGFQMFLDVFASVSVCMLQLLRMDVSKVYRVLYMGYT
jgi:hypothetical protein